jgi:hypothetical protein
MAQGLRDVRRAHRAWQATLGCALCQSLIAGSLPLRSWGLSRTQLRRCRRGDWRACRCRRWGSGDRLSDAEWEIGVLAARACRCRRWGSGDRLSDAEWEIGVLAATVLLPLSGITSATLRFWRMEIEDGVGAECTPAFEWSRWMPFVGECRHSLWRTHDGTTPVLRRTGTPWPQRCLTLTDSNRRFRLRRFLSRARGYCNDL